ncbi:Mitochondrial import inner membrane translocase subunit Tim13 [Armadillidium nasatum]|uniref:Mitochondrial import inner membrane translocase subunit n=1 Tax=Armadillidium nasatum TaxID=96803 RepID=A0A5N5T8H9_9CRUS|nr:Mitochondrial import inner membrane translocase subunit Tim13 [Armadillidium nasatum]
MDGLSSDKISPSQRDELMDQVKQQIVIANTQELLTKIGEKCFTKCISKPGSSLDNSEQVRLLDLVCFYQLWNRCFRKIFVV